jgi:hypothetical protein
MYGARNSDPSDPDVIIKLDICNASNALCRQLTLDVLGGQASSDYACGLKGDNNSKAGGQQGGPLEMIMFCLTVHHLWGRTLAKHNQDACAVAYAADGYIKARLSVALEVLSEVV